MSAPKRVLLNKSVAVIANIEPGKLRGVDSEVMVLAVTVAKDPKEVMLLLPAREAPAGSKIS